MPVRVATESDLDAILAIEEESFPAGRRWTRDDFRLAFRELVLVWAEGGIGGFLVLFRRKQEGKAVVMRIAVSPERRGAGIGEALLRAAIDRSAAEGLGEIELDVEVVRQGARRLYEKVGFRVVRAVPMRDNEFANDENGTFHVMILQPESGGKGPGSERAAPVAGAQDPPGEPAARPWDPSCPECLRELDRHMELWQAQYDEVDHGAGIYRLLFDHRCTHARGPGRADG